MRAAFTHEVAVGRPDLADRAAFLLACATGIAEVIPCRRAS
jgi:hypothetical protein